VFDGSAQELIFHNPSGHEPVAQESVVMEVDSFERFFAGRGIAILAA
jgi:hypothetical protein